MMDRDALNYFLALAAKDDVRVSTARAASIAKSHLRALDRISELEETLHSVTEPAPVETSVQSW